LGFLEYVDVLGDAVCLRVVPHHVSWEINKFTGVETPTIGVEVVDKLPRLLAGVERLGMAQVVVPKFVVGITEKLGRSTLRAVPSLEIFLDKP
jgi:hypothetical protein